MSLFKDAWFRRVVFIFGVLVPGIVFSAIMLKNDLSFCITESCLIKAKVVFWPVLTSFEAGLAIIVLWTIGFRTNQTAEQMELSILQMKKLERVNNLRDYLSHRQAFIEMLEGLEDDSFSIHDKHGLYTGVFRKNSTVEFDPSPDKDAGSWTLYSLLESYNTVVKTFEEESHYSNSFRTLRPKFLIEALTQLCILRVLLRIQEPNDFLIRGKHQSIANDLSSVPLRPEASLKIIRRVLDAIVHFAIEDQNRRDFSLLITNLSVDGSTAMTELHVSTFSNNAESAKSK